MVGLRREPKARLLVITAGTVVGLLAVYALVPISGRNQTWGLLTGAVAMLAAVPVLIRRVRGVLESEDPVAEAVAAIVLTLSLVVVGSSAAYVAVATSHPGQFHGLETKIDGVYFVVVVMSTIGFGDVAPVGQAARLMTTVHIVVTAAFVGASIRLVSWAARRRLGDR